MRLLIVTCIFLLAQVPKKSEQPIRPAKSEATAQEVPKQIEPLPTLPNPIGSAATASASKPEQTSATNTYDYLHHLVTYTNLFFTGVIALFTGLTWLVYQAMLRATKINERAWIVPIVGSIEPTGKPEEFQIRVELKNNGKTPAWITAAGSNGKGATEQQPLPDEPPYEEMKPFAKKGTLLSPTGSFIQGFPLAKDRLDHVQGGKSRLFIFGYARYRDVYGDPHIIRYCFEARKSQDANHPHPLEFYVGGPSEYIEAD